LSDRSIDGGYHAVSDFDRGVSKPYRSVDKPDREVTRSYRSVDKPDREVSLSDWSITLPTTLFPQPTTEFRSPGLIGAAAGSQFVLSKR